MRKYFLFLLLIVVILVSGCVSYGKPSAQPPANQQPSGTNAITIQNFAFSPSTLTVKVGTTVTWTNEDSVSHTVISDGGVFDSSLVSSQGPSLAKGGKFEYKFSRPGTFGYHCNLHPNMKGTIIVEQK